MQSGRLVDFKNQLMLIRAFDKVHQKHPDYVLKIYGGDSRDGTKELLEQLIAERKAEAYVFLMGASDSLERQLVNASVLRFPPTGRGFPMRYWRRWLWGFPLCPLTVPAAVQGQ